MDARPDHLVKTARERLDAGDSYGAIHLLKELVEKGQAYADAHNLLGLAYAMVGQKDEALRLLLAAVKARSDVSSIAVVDSRGLVISGMGSAEELAILGAVAEPVASGRVSDLCERLTEGTDILSSALKSGRGPLYLAALGSRVGRMHEAARGIERILDRVA